MAKGFPKFGEDDFSIETFPFLKWAISFDPEEPAAPPKIMHVGLSSDEGGGDFVPNLRFRRRPNFQTSAPGSATEIGLLPKEKEARLQEPDHLRH